MSVLTSSGNIEDSSVALFPELVRESASPELRASTPAPRSQIVGTFPMLVPATALSGIEVKMQRGTSGEGIEVGWNQYDKAWIAETSQNFKPENTLKFVNVTRRMLSDSGLTCFDITNLKSLLPFMELS